MRRALANYEDNAIDACLSESIVIAARRWWLDDERCEDYGYRSAGYRSAASFSLHRYPQMCDETQVTDVDIGRCRPVRVYISISPVKYAGP